MRDLADALGWARFSVIGVSAGASLALASAWGLAGRVTACVLASPLVPPRPRSLRYRVPAAGFRLPVAGPLTYDAALRMLHARAATAPRDMVEDYDVCRRPRGFDPAEVTVPVALWHGARDRLVPARHALELAARVRHPRGAARGPLLLRPARRRHHRLGPMRQRPAVADVAMFYGERRGGIRTYLNEKARYAAAGGAFEHHVIVPGRHEGGRHEVRSLRLAASNGYRTTCCCTTRSGAGTASPSSRTGWAHAWSPSTIRRRR